MENNVKKLKRGFGFLLPISALPSAYGIGTLGKAAYEFADFLKKTGAKYWQILPVGPTGFGDSPYQGFSAFAGNPYFIDPETLIEEGLLQREEADRVYWGDNPSYVDYGAVYNGRNEILKIAYGRSRHKETEEYREFLEESAFWLDGYAEYMAVKWYKNGWPWNTWEEKLKKRDPELLAKYKDLLSEEIDYWKFVQFKFYTQWKKLKEYVNSLGIGIIGDIPLYVSLDSSDVWTNPDIFELDEDYEPINVAGVPPDQFSETGQRWGNPLYRWDRIEETGFHWWKERIKCCAERYDAIRIDHFIGIVNYWSIPASCETAIDGKWIPGPGKKLTDAINETVPDTYIIAEDLGVLTEPVKELMAENGYPGMKILEFALGVNLDNPYLPHNFKNDNSIVYTGTHDNETLVGALSSCSDEDRKRLLRYYYVKSEAELPDAMIRAAFASISQVCILQVQDALHLGNEARMNFPSTEGGNWKWRVTRDGLNSVNTEYYRDMAEIYGRL